MVAGRPSFRYQAIVAILAILMINSLVTSLNGFWHLAATQSNLMIYSAGAVAFAWASWRFPLATAIAILLAGIGLVAAVLYGYLPGAELWLQTIAVQSSAFAQSWRDSGFASSFGPVLGVLFLIGAAVLGALVVIPESLSRGNTFWAIALGTLVFGTEWAWYYDDAATHFAVFAVLAFAVWILGKAAVRDAGWLASGRKVGYSSHVVTPLAWVLIIGFFALILPSHFEPIDLGAWGEKAQEAFPVLKQLRGAGIGGGDGRFSLRATGFSPTLGLLGGPVKLDNTVVMRFTPEKPLTETAYLRGATFQVYDGKTWSPGKTDPVEVPKDGSLPTYMGSDTLRNYLGAKVTAAVNLGGTIFHQWEPSQVAGLKSGFRADSDSNLVAARTIAKGNSYEIHSRVPIYSAEQLRKIPAADPGQAYQGYLALPASLPERVGAMTEAITEKATNPYDKAVAIEAYLRSLPYDLNVEAPPEGRDFVDYFLSDLRRGYCVYSATAMTVMLREAGIPSRLVEGYAIPTSGQYTEDASGRRSYAVLNSQAHAWVEAYFSGYGWVTFDPTPRGDLPLIDRSTPAPKTSDSTVAPGDTSGKDVNPTDPSLKEDFNEGANRTPEGAGTIAANTVKRDWPWALAALGAFGGALALAWRRLQAQERLGARESRQLVQEVWSKTGSLMSLFDTAPAPSQTAVEYAADLGQKWPALKEQAADVAREYTEARYSPPDRPVSDAVPGHARAFWDRVREVLFERYGWRTYFWRRLKRRDK